VSSTPGRGEGVGETECANFAQSRGLASQTPTQSQDRAPSAAEREVQSGYRGDSSIHVVFSDMTIWYRPFRSIVFALELEPEYGDTGAEQRYWPHKASMDTCRPSPPLLLEGIELASSS